MKIKNIKVEIKPLKEVLKDAAKVMTKIKKGEYVKPSKGLTFGDVESFREFFTPRRLELLKVIRHKQPESIYELAKLTHRDFKSVSTDIKILEKYNLIDTKKVQIKKAHRLIPIFNYDRLSVDITI